MLTLRLSPNDPAPRDVVATIGFFDGVHRGHRHLIEQVKTAARRTGMSTMAVTFERHPRQTLDPAFRPQMLNFPEEKLVRLAQTGIDYCAMLPFDREMAAMSARQFMELVLRDRLGVKALVIGYDNRFGSRRAEGFDDYVAYGRALGIRVEQAEALTLDGAGVSSSAIRRMVAQGDMEQAARFLGYHYTLMGKVVEGFRQGRRMGFPTANLDIAGHEKMVPAAGVYAVHARVEGQMEMKRAVMNIGTRPTLDDGPLSLETHIINYEGNLYGRQLIVSFDRRLRDERRFADREMLKAQLRDDIAAANLLFDKEMEK